MKKVITLLFLTISSLVFAESPELHFRSFFQRLSEEKIDSKLPLTVVHIKNEQLFDILWKDPKIKSSSLKIGERLEQFFDDTTEFPMHYTKNTIAIIYQRADGMFVRKDDGHDSDSYIYDDRLIKSKNGYFRPIYDKTIVPGIKHGFTKVQIIKAMNEKLETTPLEVTCFHGGINLGTVKFFHNEVHLNSKDLMMKDESIKIRYEKNKNTLRIHYNLNGIHGLVEGVERIKFRSNIMEQVLIPNDLLFTDKYQVSSKFTENFTDIYYPFMRPLTCSLKRKLL